jgi:SAM-dependent methyltransferase
VTRPAGIQWHGGRLHLACGAKRLSGWINSDADPAPVIQGVCGRPDVVLELPHDLETLPADALAHAYWSHGVEHVAPDLLPGALRELHRVLAAGGRLTLATIDLWAILTRRFPDGNWEGPLFGHRRSTDPRWHAHLDCFTPEKLTRLLRAAGFATVRPWHLEQYPEIAALQDYASTHADVTLYLEGVK